VKKFLMDAEMLNKWIEFKKKEASPDFQRISREENFSDPKVVGLYAAWLVGGAGLAYFKNVIAAPKFASGEWTPMQIHIPEWLPGQGGSLADVVKDLSPDVVEKVAAPVSSLADHALHNFV